MVQRSPLRTHAVAEVVRVRLLRRVMTTSPLLAGFPSARMISRPGWVPPSRAVRAAWLRSATGARVGASINASSPPGGPVGPPDGEEVGGGGVGVDDVDPVVVEVVPERACVAGAAVSYTHL